MATYLEAVQIHPRGYPERIASDIANDPEAIAFIAAEVGSGGGGGALPDWWTVDSTPGSESVTFEGAMMVSPGGVDSWGVSSEGQERLLNTPAPTDGDVPAGERWQWYDESIPALLFTQREGDGTLHKGRALSSDYDTGVVGIKPTDTSVSTSFYVQPPVGYANDGGNNIYEARYEDGSLCWQVGTYGNATLWGPPAVIGEGEASLTVYSSEPFTRFDIYGSGRLTSTILDVETTRKRIATPGSFAIIPGNWVPADVGLTGLEMYYDNTTGAPKLKMKARDNAGDLFTGEIALTPV
jgi:hypothetical protein